MNGVCGDNRFKIIEKVKNHLLKSTNITQKELEVVDNILFRLWQLDYFENVYVEEMTGEELKKTYPDNTVFLYKKNGVVLRANTSDFYVARGKDYQLCSEAIKKNPCYTEVQDKNLYQVVQLLEKAQQTEIDKDCIVNGLKEIVFQLNSIIDDLEM